MEKKEFPISDEAMTVLENYNWPGNVRELENVVELIINSESFPTKYFIENINQEVWNQQPYINEQAANARLKKL